MLIEFFRKVFTVILIQILLSSQLSLNRNYEIFLFFFFL